MKNTYRNTYIKKPIAKSFLIVLIFAMALVQYQSMGHENGTSKISLEEAEEKIQDLRKGERIIRRVYKGEDAEEAIVKMDWGTLNWLAAKNIGNAEGLTLGHVTFKVGKGGARHIHFKAEEVLYVLKGRVRQTWDDHEVILVEGDTFWVDRGVPHHAENIGDVLAEVIVVYDSAERDYVQEADYKKNPSAYPKLKKPVRAPLK